MPCLRRPDRRSLEVNMAASVRIPAVAGTFYPGSRTTLKNAVDGYLADAQVELSGRVRAVIAPHAGYVYSGPTAGFAFKALGASLPDGEVTLYLLGPAHRVWFDGVSTGDFDFSTPLGVAPTDRLRVEALWETNKRYTALPDAHHGEHCLEVQIPFLQRIAPQLQLVPLLFGNVDARAVGRDLLARLRSEPQARLVISSDLSHFHDYETAYYLDRQFLRHVQAGDIDAVEADRHGACGRMPIMALLTVAAELGWTSHLLDYRTSGDTSGDQSRVVGYAALAFTEASTD